MKNTRSIQSEPEIRPAAIVLTPSQGLAVASALIGNACDLLAALGPQQTSLDCINENLDVTCKVFRKWPGLFQAIYTQGDKFVELDEVGTFIRDAISVRLST